MARPLPRLTDLKKLRAPIENVNTKHRETLTRSERLAAWISDHVGTSEFFLLIFLWTVLWLSWNTLAPPNARFDPFPAFVLWLFLSNMIQILLMPLLMVSQNLQARHAERRAEADFTVNVTAEREIEAVLLRLERQQELIMKVLSELERSRVMKPATKKEKLPSNARKTSLLLPLLNEFRTVDWKGIKQELELSGLLTLPALIAYKNA